MTEIEWTEPPGRTARPRRVGKHAAIAAELKARPGEWALILRDAPASMVSSVNKAYMDAYGPRGSFEAVGRNHNRAASRCDVYARFVGGGAA